MGSVLITSSSERCLRQTFFELGTNVIYITQQPKPSRDLLNGLFNILSKFCETATNKKDELLIL